MTETLRCYDVSNNNGFVSRVVLDALGVAPHVRQAYVSIVAGSKKAAAALYNEMRVGQYLRPEDLTLSGGNDVKAILAAGFHQRPGVFIRSMEGGNNRRVLRATGNGRVKLAGYLHHEPGAGGRVSLIGSTAQDGDTAAPRSKPTTDQTTPVRLTSVETGMLVELVLLGSTIEKEATGTFVIGAETRGWTRARRPAVTKLIEHGLIEEHRQPRPQAPHLGDRIFYLPSQDGRAWVVNFSQAARAA